LRGGTGIGEFGSVRVGGVGLSGGGMWEVASGGEGWVGWGGVMENEGGTPILSPLHDNVRFLSWRLYYILVLKKIHKK
jgi:hypothetical protein